MVGTQNTQKTRLNLSDVCSTLDITPSPNRHGTAVMQPMTHIDEAHLYRCIWLRSSLIRAHCQNTAIRIAILSLRKSLLRLIALFASIYAILLPLTPTSIWLKTKNSPANTGKKRTSRANGIALLPNDAVISPTPTWSDNMLIFSLLYLTLNVCFLIVSPFSRRKVTKLILHFAFCIWKISKGGYAIYIY